MFDRMEIAESIQEGVVEPSYKNPATADTNRASDGRKMRGEAALSNT